MPQGSAVSKHVTMTLWYVMIYTAESAIKSIYAGIMRKWMPRKYVSI